MDRIEYLSKLNKNLITLPLKERNAAIRYYNKYFEDAGLVNEQDVISNLGTPDKLAQKILNNNSKLFLIINNTKKGVKSVKKKLNPRQKFIAILLIILSFPIWGSIIVGAAGIILGLFIAIAAVMLALVISGIALVCMGIANIINIFSIGLVLVGTGMILGSLPFLLFLPLINLWFKLLKFTTMGFIILINKILGKTEVNV